MKYLYSRSLGGPPEPAAKPKKRAPKKQAAPKPKPQPQTPKPQTPARATTNFNGQQPVPLPSPSQLKNSIPNHTAAARVNAQLNQSSSAAVTSNPIPPPTSTPNAPTHSIGKHNNNIPRSDKENTIKAAKQTEPVKRSESVKEVNSAQKSSSSKTVEKSTVTDPKKKAESAQTSDEATSKTRLSKKAKLSLSFLEDPIEESQSNELSKKEVPATSRTRSTHTTKEKTTSTPGKVGRPASKPAEKKQPAKRGRKRVIESETEEDEEDDLPQPRKKAATSRRPIKDLPILSDTYKLSMVFQGHTDINIPAKSINDDDLTDAKDIWCCEFEPPRKGQLIHNVVAICGSYSVLLLDTQQGRYIKKFTHAEIQEIFYCMAWTTLTGPELLNDEVSEDESCNILAVAGRLGSIKLLNPLQNECYRYLFGHNQAVLKLAFAKAEPRWLFSASADKTVRLWDIGSPTSRDDDSVCLAKFNLPPRTGVPSALHISHDLTTLLVGFDDGDMVSFKITPQLLEKFRTKSASLRTKESRTGDKWHDFGPIATIDPKTTYPKGEEWHAGYIDDIYIFGQDGDKSNRLYNKILSRGADDMEFIIWDPVKSTKSDADILVALEWPDSAGCTGARFKVIEAEGQTVLIAGEYDGQVYIYNLGDMKNSKTLSDGSLEQYKPTRMLSHPMSSELIRDVCCSHDTRTIVAVDNNNTAFIWNCTDNNN